MRTYTVIAEQYNEEKSERFAILADSQDKAWARAYHRCAEINQLHGKSLSPVDVFLSQGEDQ
jgi:hypothetical protein